MQKASPSSGRSSRKSRGERICYDPCAKYFVRPWVKGVIGLAILSGIAEWQGPGAMAFQVARARYIDDYLSSSIADGLRQSVILGAGFDSRAYRFPGLKGQVKTFEVDHPATQRVKLARLEKTFVSVPKHVTYVPVDFDRDNLGDRLYSSGYDNKLKTLFIWEGVTFQLRRSAVDDTLGFVAHNSGPGSSIIFGYTHKPVSNGIAGEGLVFGIEEGKVGEYLERRGFDHAVSVTGDDLHRMYFKGANESRKVAPAYCIVNATVMPTY